MSGIAISSSSGSTVEQVLELTGNSGSPVGPSGLGNINVIGDGTSITVAGNPGTNTLTASVIAGSSEISITGDTGSAISGSSLNIISDVAAINCGSSVQFAGNGTTTLTLNVTDASNNVAIGLNAGSANLINSSNNTVVGVGALQALNSFYGGSTVLGYQALNSLTTGGAMTVLGATAGSSMAGVALWDILIGQNAGTNYTTSESYNILIGSNGVIGESKTLRICDAANASSSQALTATYIGGIDSVALTTANVVTESGDQLGTAVITAGTGISIDAASTPNQIIINATGGGFTWTDVTGGSATLAAGNGYIADAGGLTTFTLPTNNAFGDTIVIVGKGSGGWTIIYTTGQNIIFGSSTTATTSGSLSSTNANDCCWLVCTTASATAPIFSVINAVGNLTIV